MLKLFIRKKSLKRFFDFGFNKVTFKIPEQLIPSYISFRVIIFMLLEKSSNPQIKTNKNSKFVTYLNKILS